jgi:signal transduction histidine kinase
MGYLEPMRTSARVAEPHAKDRVEPGRLTEEQAALRRVATLVARGASSTEVFTAVAEEVAHVMQLPLVAIGRYDDEAATLTVVAAWSDRPHGFQPGTQWPLDGPSLSTEVLRTGRPARVEDYADVPGSVAAQARESGLTRGAGAPIVVGGRVWGLISATSPDAPLPDQVEDRLAAFTDLVATAISNGQAQDELTRLAEEQAALRRVATLVAEGAPPAEVFKAVSMEVAQLVPSDGSALTRYEADGTVTAVGGWTTEGGYNHVGTRYSLEGTVSGVIHETGRPGRVDNYDDAPGEAPEAARAMGWRSSVGAPITVEGRLWGVLAIVSKGKEPLPFGTERRLAEFTELIAAAIANTEGREELAELAEEQAALRRVATLVAEDAPPSEVFEEVISGVGRLVGSDAAALIRFDSERTATAMSSWSRMGPTLAVGFQYPVSPGMAAWLVRETHQPARIDSYDGVSGIAAAIAREQGWRSSVAAPVIVEGRLWGMAIVYSTHAEPLPADTEERLAKFTRLVETSVANAESRAELARLAEEQAALRRVATLVAQGATPTKVFEAVAAEVGGLIPADAAGLGRYETDGVTAVASWTKAGGYLPLGARRTLSKGTAAQLVFETRRPGRIDDYEGVPGTVAAAVRGWGWRSAVGAPVIVEGRLWGLILVASTSDRPLPPDTEERLAQFTELVATAIANTESRAELDASRARIVATADATRRRIERDLHDGAQQQLLSLALEVRAVQAAAPPELREHRAELAQVAEGLTNVLDGLREIALGIHPGILVEGGLGPALKTLAHRSPIPVELDVRVEGRLPGPVEVTAYYIVSEALTNAAKHADASNVRVDVDVRDRALRVAVHDDGLGGADPARGSGLLGLKDRAEAIGGTILVESRHEAGTSLVSELPLDDQTH